MRSILAAAVTFALVIPTMVARPSAQAASDARPSFETASIKPSAPGQDGQSTRRQPGGRATVRNMPLRDLVRFVYQIQDFQLEGVPGWAANERYDIVAKAAGDPPPVPPGGTEIDPMILMLRTLLEDRFHLVAHRETKELPIYALVVARPGAVGPDLHRSATDCMALYNAATAAARAGGPPATLPSTPDGRPMCGTRVGPGTIVAGAMPMSQFATTLSRMVARTVVDRTALDGPFDLQVTFESEPPPLPPGARLQSSDQSAPSLFTALQEQLGLKLESTRGAVEIIVVDRLERPIPD
jgi:uncharacterized protein (TIGR03435 family)